MTDDKGHISQTDDSRITNTGALVQLTLGDEERKALRWLAPLLILVGFNFATSVALWMEFHNADNDALLVYSHQIKCEAQWEARGYDPTVHCGQHFNRGK